MPRIIFDASAVRENQYLSATRVVLNDLQNQAETNDQHAVALLAALREAVKTHQDVEIWQSAMFLFMIIGGILAGVTLPAENLTSRLKDGLSPENITFALSLIAAAASTYFGLHDIPNRQNNRRQATVGMLAQNTLNDVLLGAAGLAAQRLNDGVPHLVETGKKNNLLIEKIFMQIKQTLSASTEKTS